MSIVATEEVRRDMDYGLAFYRNQPTTHYSVDGVPARSTSWSSGPATPETSIAGWVAAVYQPLFLFEPQGFAVYRVSAKKQ